MFGTKYVKLPKNQWEEIKKEFKQLQTENEFLKNKLNEIEAQDLYEIIKSQSKTIEKLTQENEKNKELLEFYEKSFYELKDKISIKNQEIFDLKQKLEEKNKEIQKLTNKLNATADLYSFVVKKYVKKDKSCPEYEEVSILDIKG